MTTTTRKEEGQPSSDERVQKDGLGGLRTQEENLAWSGLQGGHSDDGRPSGLKQTAASCSSDRNLKQTALMERFG